jgi:hypothetical protein
MCRTKFEKCTRIWTTQTSETKVCICSWRCTPDEAHQTNKAERTEFTHNDYKMSDSDTGLIIPRHVMLALLGETARGCEVNWGTGTGLALTAGQTDTPGAGIRTQSLQVSVPLCHENWLTSLVDKVSSSFAKLLYEIETPFLRTF